MATKYLDYAGLQSLLGKLFERKFKGLGLSKNDFTDTLKSKLEAITSPEDLTALQTRVAAIEKLVESDTDGAINKFNEIVAFLEGVKDTETLDGLVSGKVDKEAGKGLSANDYTDADKAEVAKIAGKLDASALTAITEAEILALLEE